MAAQTYIKGGTSVQIAASIEQAIRENRLVPGEQLPTVRALADRLRVSPATVANAYKGLRTRGLLAASGRRGTAVSLRPPVSARLPAPVPSGVRNLAHGNPDVRLLPPLADALRTIDASHVLYGMELKDPALIDLATRDLKRDGISADSLTVVSGAMDGIERVLTAHLRAGDRVVVEDPGFSGVLDLLAALGLSAVPCAIDDSGMLPDALAAALRSGAQAIVVTPRAQNPTGAAIDETRSRELERVLRGYPDVLVIEDDHAGWVAGAPLFSLCASQPRRWAFVRSLCKSLGPDLRLAILSGDAETVARVEGRQVTGMRWVSRLLQRTAVAVWSARATGPLLRNASRAYGERRRALIDALAGHGIEAHGRTGMNVWIPTADETPVVQALLQQGWAITAGARFRLRSEAGVRVTVAALDMKEAARLARAIAETIRPHGLSASA